MSTPVSGVGPRGAPGSQARTPAQVADDQMYTVGNYPAVDRAEQYRVRLSHQYWQSRKGTAAYRRIARAAAVAAEEFKRRPVDHTNSPQNVAARESRAEQERLAALPPRLRAMESGEWVEAGAVTWGPDGKAYDTSKLYGQHPSQLPPPAPKYPTGNGGWGDDGYGSPDGGDYDSHGGGAGGTGW